jgi:hypothetical protein
MVGSGAQFVFGHFEFAPDSVIGRQSVAVFGSRARFASSDSTAMGKCDSFFWICVTYDADGRRDDQ